MLSPRNAINLESKGSRGGKKRSKKQRKKCRGRKSVSSAVFVCVWGWGDGVNWYRIKLGGPEPTHTTFCVQINVTPTPLWSPLPLLFFFSSVSGVRSCTACMCKQPCTIKHGPVCAPPTQQGDRETGAGKPEPTLKDWENQIRLKHFIRTHCIKNEMSSTPSSTIQPSDCSDSGFTLSCALLLFDWLTKWRGRC